MSSLWAAPAKPPNILLIISDDQAWNDYGFMGHPSIRTPRLDRLAAESACFTRGYVPSSLCCPSLASVLTGLPPQRHRVVCNDPPRPPSIRCIHKLSVNELDYQRQRAQKAGRA
ncbi:MAG: hypothetical protein EXS25_02065 [Pedosphaera sp.]|nr:hypothetical protein [Pedosphaera sp.]